MEVNLYNWDKCPTIFKEAAPFTKYFFEEGSEVSFILVAKNSTVDDFKQWLAKFSNSPSDQLRMFYEGSHYQIAYWTKGPPSELDDVEEL